MSDEAADHSNRSGPLPGSDLSGVPDEALIAAYLHGDQSAFEALYQRYRGPLYRYLVRQLPKALAEEAFQDTWLKIIKALPNYTDQGKLQAFLFRICHNVLMDVHRASMRQLEETDAQAEVEDDSADVVAKLSGLQLQQQLYQQLARLPLAQRSAWILKHETQLSLNEIADLTESTVEGVKSRLRYATDKLKQRMQKYV